MNWERLDSRNGLWFAAEGRGGRSAIFGGFLRRKALSHARDSLELGVPLPGSILYLFSSLSLLKSALTSLSFLPDFDDSSPLGFAGLRQLNAEEGWWQVHGRSSARARPARAGDGRPAEWQASGYCS